MSTRGIAHTLGTWSFYDRKKERVDGWMGGVFSDFLGQHLLGRTVFCCMVMSIRIWSWVNGWVV